MYKKGEVLVIFFVLNFTLQSQPTENERLNIVVLVTDDQRWDALGAAGNEIIHTPRIDQLAEEGIRFTNAYVTTSICMVSRASILTGQHMSRHNITQFGVEMESEAFARTYPALLREAGYWTGFIGKYGIGQIRKEDFDVALAYQGQHWLEGDDGEHIHITEKNTRDAIEFLRERPKNKPFLLNVSYFTPHAEDRNPKQYLPQDWSAKYYEEVSISESPLMDKEYWNALPMFLNSKVNEGRRRYYWRYTNTEHYQESLTNYYRLITEVDASLGRLIDELKEQGVYENTLILFTSDNGFFHAERGLTDKYYPYEESIRVPLVVHDPRQTEDGITRDEMVLNIDLAPTILSAAGLSIPTTMQGDNLAPLYLLDNQPKWREEFFYQHPTLFSKYRIPASQAVVQIGMKYVYWPEWDYEQLFDLKKDPTEKSNLIDSPNLGYSDVAAYSDELKVMREKLKIWQQKVR